MIRFTQQRTSSLQPTHTLPASHQHLVCKEQLPNPIACPTLAQTAGFNGYVMTKHFADKMHAFLLNKKPGQDLSQIVFLSRFLIKTRVETLAFIVDEKPRRNKNGTGRSDKYQSFRSDTRKPRKNRGRNVTKNFQAKVFCSICQFSFIRTCPHCLRNREQQFNAQAPLSTERHLTRK